MDFGPFLGIGPRNMMLGSYWFILSCSKYCSRPNRSQVTTQNVPKNGLGDIWGSAWLLVIMNGPINQKLK